MFEEALRELAAELIDGAVEVVEDFDEAPEREPDEYYWFSMLDGAGPDGLNREDVTHSYTFYDVPDRQGVIVLALWKRPMGDSYYVHGTLGEFIHEEYAEEED